jgi:ATP-dependent Clp protease ATP-binding subunit ClpA
LADALVEEHVEHCRTHSSSWADIGAALGVTRQAVQKPFNGQALQPESMTDDLRRALAHVKQAAVQHRSIYIGTEHLLWGLTAEDNSATRLLLADGVSPKAVHRLVGTRLSTGASHAAERIAWTPCSRKAIAFARTRSEHNGSDRTDCDDLLIGLARLDREVAPDILAEAGFAPSSPDAGPRTPAHHCTTANDALH